MRSPAAAAADLLVFLALVVIVLCPAQQCHGKELDRQSSPRVETIVQSSLTEVSVFHRRLKTYERDRQLRGSRNRALLSDCSDLTGDAKYVIAESLSVLQKVSKNRKSKSRRSRLEQVQTDLSAALTDITTCTDELRDELANPSHKMKIAVADIKQKASNVSKLLSKALRLIAAAE